jgi:hypothetical protein
VQNVGDTLSLECKTTVNVGVEHHMASMVKKVTVNVTRKQIGRLGVEDVDAAVVVVVARALVQDGEMLCIVKRAQSTRR